MREPKREKQQKGANDSTISLALEVCREDGSGLDSWERSTLKVEPTRICVGDDDGHDSHHGSSHRADHRGHRDSHHGIHGAPVTMVTIAMTTMTTMVTIANTEAVIKQAAMVATSRLMTTVLIIAPHTR